MTEKPFTTDDEQLRPCGKPGTSALDRCIERPAAGQQGQASQPPSPEMLALRDAVQRLEILRRRRSGSGAVHTE